MTWQSTSRNNRLSWSRDMHQGNRPRAGVCAHANRFSVRCREFSLTDVRDEGVSWRAARKLARLSPLAALPDCRLVDFFVVGGTGPAERAVRIQDKLAALTPLQQEALGRLVDEVVAMVSDMWSAQMRRTKKISRGLTFDVPETGSV